jgi:hypothetical protein
MRRGELALSIGDHDESREPRHLPAKQSDDVERGAIGLMDVLENHHRGRAPGELAGKRRRDLVHHRAARHQVLELPSRRFGHVEERPEWPRREQRVAVAPENSRGAAQLSAETMHERRLPDPSFAVDEDQAPAPGACDLAHSRAQRRQAIGALEQRVRTARCVGSARRHHKAPDRHSAQPEGADQGPAPSVSSAFQRESALCSRVLST